MCGIVSIFSKLNAGVNRELLVKMNDSLYHRGPDDSGIYVDGHVGLGHRRLSILDIHGGQQPIFNEDRTVVVVFNGEIYNFLEIKSELERKGHVFKTHCDTEVIVHGWEEWSEKCLDKFRGMFAFVLWDKKKKQLFFARDRLGEKPLYYTQLNTGELLIASELKAILQHPGTSKKLNINAIEDYFSFGHIPDPKSIFEGIFKLKPGHYVILDTNYNQIQSFKYWDVPNNNKQHSVSQEELIERLSEAVKIMMISDVPIGAFLSGGVDSSTVVAFMSKLSGDSINTCSISFNDPKYNEEQYANAIAKRFNTHHYVEQVEIEELDFLDRLIDIFDEPFSDSSAIPTYKLCNLARKNVTVALSGDGGDEVFAGYNWYYGFLRANKLGAFLPEGLKNILHNIYLKTNHNQSRSKINNILFKLSSDIVGRVAQNSMISTPGQRKYLYDDGFTRKLSGYSSVQVVKGYVEESNIDEPLALAQYVDQKVYLASDILTKVDRTSMANSLEVRVPMLDYKLIEWASQLAPDAKLKGKTTKYILKKAMENVLPYDVLYRDKMGFSVPISDWLRGSLHEKVRSDLLSSPVIEMGYIRYAAADNLLREHRAGTGDHGTLLWSMLVLDKFLRERR